MFVALPLLLLVLAAHLSACSADAAVSASTASKTTEIGGRLYYRHSLLPVDECYSKDYRSSELKQVVLKETLEPLLIDPLIEIVAGYAASRSLQFAEELYAELWNGKTDLLHNELYDAERNMLIEPHAFWDYLAQGAQPVVGFMQILMEAETKHQNLEEQLRSFAVLVSAKVAQAAYLIGKYLGNRVSLDCMRASLDSWPQALLDDHTFFRASAHGSLELMTRVYYLLKQSNVEQFRKLLYSKVFDKNQWFYVFCTLHELEPTLLRKFFDINLAKDSSRDREFFEMTAPIAMCIDSALSRDLIAVAKHNGWAEPVAEQIKANAELADNAEAGGSVYMQPLMPVDRILDSAYHGLYFAGSTTLKTVASKYRRWQLHIAAGNVLCAFSHSSETSYFYIRSFEDGKVDRHDLKNDNSVKMHVQHGDVIAMDWGEQITSVISKEFHCTGLSEKERFECIKSFCYAARYSTVDFVAIVENDGHGEPKGSEVKVEMGGEVKDEEQVGNVGEEELQES